MISFFNAVKMQKKEVGCHNALNEEKYLLLFLKGQRISSKRTLDHLIC